MKKKILLLAAAAVCIGILTSGTMAYFTAEDQVHNVITTDSVDIEIEEWQKRPEGLIPYPKEEPISVMPGVTVSKIATVKNLAARSYIRAKYEVIFKDAEGNVMELSDNTLNNLVSITMGSDLWIGKDGDGEWWYYTESVSKDTSTEPLFTEIVFNGPNMTNEYQNCTIEVIVSGQAVQTANNGSSVLEAVGWPKE